MKKEVKIGLLLACLFLLVSVVYILNFYNKALVNTLHDLLLSPLYYWIRDGLGAAICGSVLFHFQCRAILAGILFTITSAILGFFVGFEIAKLFKKSKVRS